MLNDRQELFCQEVVKGAALKRAYITAYPRAKSWKDTTVDSRASNFAKKPQIAARIEELRKQAAANSAITRDEIIAELKAVGFAQTSKKIIPRDKIRALEVMAKILGFDQVENEPSSVEDLTIIAELLNVSNPEEPSDAG